VALLRYDTQAHEERKKQKEVSLKFSSPQSLLLPDLTQQYNTETQFDIMSLQEFKSYVESTGEVFDDLGRDDKIAWKESFDKSRGKLYSYLILSHLSTPLN
jgi:hypothetical protein